MENGSETEEARNQLDKTSQLQQIREPKAGQCRTIIKAHLMENDNK